MSHNITQLVERAARQYLLNNLPSWLPETQVYRGIENRESEDMEGQESSLRVYPCVICICENASAVTPNFKGNWTPQLMIEVWNSRASTTGDVHDERACAVFDLFCTETISSDLSSAIEEFCARSVVPMDQGFRTEGRAWVSYMTFTLGDVIPRSFE